MKKCDTTNQSCSNYLSKELQHSLRKRTYSFEKSEKIVDSFDQRNKKVIQNVGEINCDTESTETSRLGSVEDTDIIKLRPAEKRTVSLAVIYDFKYSYS